MKQIGSIVVIQNYSDFFLDELFYIFVRFLISKTLVLDDMWHMKGGEYFLKISGSLAHKA